MSQHPAHILWLWEETTQSFHFKSITFKPYYLTQIQFWWNWEISTVTVWTL